MKELELKLEVEELEERIAPASVFQFLSPFAKAAAVDASIFNFQAAVASNEGSLVGVALAMNNAVNLVFAGALVIGL